MIAQRVCLQGGQPGQRAGKPMTPLEHRMEFVLLFNYFKVFFNFNYSFFFLAAPCSLHGGLKPSPGSGSAKSQPLGHQGIP